ncbi:MAG: serine/threonine protein kinase [Deltaproteobacteria bacterium]|nr:serine/threonine protein kinase [Deltaproteobacteria bacterium]
MIFNKSFGNYRLAKKLATGGMADLFLAVRQGEGGFERLVVIKSLLPHLLEQDATRTLFLQEGLIGGRIEHANVVRVLDADVAEGRPFLVLEYVAGANLDELVAQGGESALSADDAARCIADAAYGLAAAHRATNRDGRPLAVVHRDISPHNLLVGVDGRTRLFDFGVAQTAASEPGSTKTAGKTAYMSPEQCRGHELDGRSDLFALGVVFHELLTGRRLFARDSYMASLRAITEEEIAPPSQVRAGVPAELDAIVMKLLEREPEDRIASADLVAEELERWLAGRSPAAWNALGAKVAAGFAATLEEDQAVALKVLAAPVQTESTVDLANFRYSGSAPAVAETPAQVPPAAAVAPAALGAAVAVPAAGQAAQATAKRTTRLAIAVALVCAGLALFAVTRQRPVAPASPVAAAPQTVPAAMPTSVAELTGGPGAVRVVYEPADATLFVDGTASGSRSPADIASLALGKEHSLRLESVGFETISFPFTLDSAEVLEIQLQLSPAVPVGKVDLLSEPAGAEVWVAGNRLGVTPLLGVELAANKNFVIEFRRAGASTVRRAIFVRSGANPPVEVKPAVAAVPKPAPAASAPAAPAATARKPLPKTKNADGKYPLLTE